jgi:hypothetical protein
MTPTETQSSDLTQHGLQQGHYGFTAVDVNKLEATEYTIAQPIFDRSGSVGSFKDQLEQMLGTVVQSCRNSPHEENLMIRAVQFGSDIEEIHGFKLLTQCQPNDYKGAIHISGMTALLDALLNGIDAASAYASQMAAMDYTVNVVNFIATDGYENASRIVKTPQEIADRVQEIRRDEQLESMINILIGLGVDTKIDASLQQLKDDAGLDQYINIGDVTPENLAKLGNFISQSISSQSQARGSGAKSQLLAF